MNDSALVDVRYRLEPRRRVRRDVPEHGTELVARGALTDGALAEGVLR